jgi:hypothetical protein
MDELIVSSEPRRETFSLRLRNQFLSAAFHELVAVDEYCVPPCDGLEPCAHVWQESYGGLPSMEEWVSNRPTIVDGFKPRTLELPFPPDQPEMRRKAER